MKQTSFFSIHARSLILLGMLLNWQGIYCALWTPTDEQGALLREGLRSNLELLKRSGIQGLLAMGSTGEFPHLEVAERKRVLEEIRSQAGPLRLIVNVSDIRPSAVAELGRFARQLGADAISLLPPHFFPLAQEDLIEHFVRAAEAAQLPLFLYNFPERTGNRIAIETVAAVAGRVPVAGVKQSGSEFDYHRALVQLGREKNFVVLTGADTRLPEARAMGVVGCVSGLSNAVPEIVLGSLEESDPARNGPKPNAERMTELAKRIPVVSFPRDVAACMEARGLVVGFPKSVVSPQTQKRYQQLVGELRELFQQWKLSPCT